jgi:hypothetical protein
MALDVRKREREREREREGERERERERGREREGERREWARGATPIQQGEGRIPHRRDGLDGKRRIGAHADLPSALYSHARARRIQQRGGRLAARAVARATGDAAGGRGPAEERGRGAFCGRGDEFCFSC